jgi:hypothetical protein
MKTKQNYRLRLKAERLQGKIHCPGCTLRFHTPLSMLMHGVRIHGWRYEPAEEGDNYYIGHFSAVEEKNSRTIYTK